MIRWKPMLHIAALTCCLMSGAGLALCDEPSQTKPVEYKPLWEAGVTGLVLAIPHYVGADEYYTFAIPLPYFVYRGEVFKSDRDGLRGLFFKSDRFETDISLGGNLPVNSENNEAREDMPELDTLAEIGPAIRYYFHRRGKMDHLYLQAAWRGALSFDFDGGLDIGASYRGQRYKLDLKYKNESLFKEQNLTFYINTGLSYADDILNGYFYDVQTKFVTPDRDPYNADAGYAGAYITGSVIKDLTPTISIGTYISWVNINGTVFEDSPLVRTSNNIYFSAFVIWKFAKSEEMVKVSD